MTRGKHNVDAKQRETEMKPTARQVESFDHRRQNPVATDGTTEVPFGDAVITEPNDSIRQRYEAAERQKEKDIAELVKQSDGKPKV